MKNFKKFFKFFLITILTIGMFSACSKDDDPKPLSATVAIQSGWGVYTTLGFPYIKANIEIKNTGDKKISSLYFTAIVNFTNGTSEEITVSFNPLDLEAGNTIISSKDILFNATTTTTGGVTYVNPWPSEINVKDGTIILA